MAKHSSSDGARAQRKGRHSIIVLTFVIGLVASVFAGIAYGATDTKPYRAVISPASVAAGSSTQFSLTIYNDANPQQIGSANITPPPGFTVTAATPTANASVVGNTVQLRNLSLQPGLSRTFTITATAPCSSSTGTWSTTVKQANNFSGPPGNDFSLSAAGSSLTTEVTGGGCHLNFFTQPADAEKTAPISTTKFNTPTGTSVQVEVLDGNNNRITGSAATITVAISPTSPDPELGAVLSGTVTKNAASGVASFTNLSINLHGTYNLRATSPGITFADSSPPFIIWDEAQPCTTAQCTATLGNRNDFEASLSGKSTNGGFLLLSLGQDELSCGDTFNHAPSVITGTTYRFDSTTTKTLVGYIDKEVVQQEANNGAAFYRVCFLSDDTDFTYPAGVTVTTADGTITGPEPIPMGTPFLLPECNKAGNTPPCVKSITKTNAGDVVETIILPKNDIFRSR